MRPYRRYPKDDPIGRRRTAIVSTRSTEFGITYRGNTASISSPNPLATRDAATSVNTST